MSTLSTILAVVLGLAFVAAAIPKLASQAGVVASFERWGLAPAVRIATGAVELLAGALLLLGIAVTAVAITGVLLVIATMVGALFTHRRAADPIATWMPAALLLALAIVLALSLLP
jgi:putative oxidoreductase